MAEGGDWIDDAIKRPGAFKEKAEERGMSTKEFAAKGLFEFTDLGTNSRRWKPKLFTGCRHASFSHYSPEVEQMMIVQPFHYSYLPIWKFRKIVS